MSADHGDPLARLDTATRLLAEARSVDEVKEIRDKAEVARQYARERNLGIEAQNYAAEIKLRAERKLGELLAGTVERGGDQRSGSKSNRTTLNQLGVSKDESSRWQQIATLPEPAFEEHIAEAKASGEPLTTAGVVRAADLASRGFDPSTLPPMRLSRAESAYFAVPKLFQWLDVNPADVADAASSDRLVSDQQAWLGLVVWLNSVIAEMGARSSNPHFEVVGNGRS